MIASGHRGYAMAALLVAMSVMAVIMSVAMPVWNTMTRREKEEELIFRGQQYARAITLFQRRYPGTYPPNLDILLNEKHLRKRYKDPMTADGEFQLIPAGSVVGQPAQPAAGRGQAPQQGRGAQPTDQRITLNGAPGQVGPQAGIQGVVSKNTGQALRLYNGRDRYNEWAFIAVAATAQAGGGAGGTATPGVPGRGGAPGLPGRGQQPGRGAQPGRGGQQPQPPGVRGLGGRFGQPQPQQPQQPGGRRGF
jgi:type II secretory pathway pseudopilin PulG